MNIENKLRVVLIYLRSFDHYSYWNPLSIESLIGHLKGKLSQQIYVHGLDIREKEQIKKIDTIIRNYDVVGFSVSSYTLEVLQEILHSCKLFDKKVVVGNQLATYLPDSLFEFFCAHSDVKKENLYMLLGEGEETIEKVIKKIHAKECDFHDIPNIVYYSGENGLLHTKKEFIDLKNLKFIPSYLDEINPEKTYQMQLSRGCYWGACVFCTRYSFRHNKRWQSFNLTRIFADLKEIIITKDANNIEFCDDEFFGGRKNENLIRAYCIAKKIKELCDQRGRKINYRIFTRPDFIFNKDDFEQNKKVQRLLFFMKKTGLARIYLGIESGCDSQLKRYNRGIDLEIIKGALKSLQEIDLKFDSGFILFDPDLELNEIIDNIKFYKENDIIETNQWFWRPMIANIGSIIGKRFLEMGKEADLNSMSIEYSYSDKIIQYLYEITDFESRKTRNLFYALKSISKKDYDYEDENEYNSIAHEIVKKNGMIYVNLLEKITKAILEEREEINTLLMQVKRVSDGNMFSSRDREEILMHLKEIYMNNQIDE